MIPYSQMCNVCNVCNATLMLLVFDKSDLIALRVKRKQSTSPNAIRIVLYRWKKAGKIEQVEGLAKYRQLKKS